MNNNNSNLKINENVETPDKATPNESTVNSEVNLHDTKNTIDDSIDEGNKVLVFGNDIKVEKPYKMGGVYTFLFYDGEPLIIFGKQGNIFIFLYSLILIYI